MNWKAKVDGLISFPGEFMESNPYCYEEKGREKGWKEFQFAQMIWKLFD